MAEKKTVRNNSEKQRKDKTRERSSRTEASLQAELERLKNILKQGYELKVRWIPKNSGLSGEVRGNYIYIYDEETEVALETLKHEFIDCTISKVIEPYKEVTNRLIALINEDCYRKKEKLVEDLCRLIDQ